MYFYVLTIFSSLLSSILHDAERKKFKFEKKKKSMHVTSKQRTSALQKTLNISANILDESLESKMYK